MCRSYFITPCWFVSSDVVRRFALVAKFAKELNVSSFGFQLVKLDAFETAYSVVGCTSWIDTVEMKTDCVCTLSALTAEPRNQSRTAGPILRGAGRQNVHRKGRGWIFCRKTTIHRKEEAPPPVTEGGLSGELSFSGLGCVPAEPKFFNVVTVTFFLVAVFTPSLGLLRFANRPQMSALHGWIYQP